MTAIQFKTILHGWADYCVEHGGHKNNELIGSIIQANQEPQMRQRASLHATQSGTFPLLHTLQQRCVREADAYRHTQRIGAEQLFGACDALR